MGETLGQKALRFIGLSGQAITVTPGDALYGSLNGVDDVPATYRDLAKHWAVRAVTGHIARGVRGLDGTVAMFDGSGQRLRDQRGMEILRPHLARIALDVSRFGEAIAVVAKDDIGTPHELIPLPPDEVEVEYRAGEAKLYKLGTEEFQPERIFHVALELPASSPLDSLRGVLEEDLAASDWRCDAWKTAPRGIVGRGLDAPEWSGRARERFQASFLAGLTGKRVPVLEDGMEWNDAPLPDAGSAQFIECRKLCAEIVASTFGVQGSLLAIGADKQLGPARRQLLRGPVAEIATAIADAYSQQLAVPMYGVNAVNGRITVVFDVEGAVRKEDEEPSLVQAAVGVSWRTPNEQRLLEGRPPIDGGDVLAQPAVRNVVTRS